MSCQRQVYFGGRLVSEPEARISIFDSALMFGDMVFEMTRSFNGVPFRLRDHLERLYTGLRIFEIDCGLTLEQMEAATLRTVEVNLPCFPPGIDFQIMHNVSRGILAAYQGSFPPGPMVTINCWPLTSHLAPVAAFYETGVHAVVPEQRSIPARLLDPKVKNRSRAHYQMANLQARQVDPQAWALLTDEDGFLTEGSGANFFLVRRGELLTPEPRNILRGVTRQVTMTLAARLGIPCRECNLEGYDVVTADEAFFTSTPFVMVPVARFNGHVVGDRVPGPVFRRLLTAWCELAGVNIVAQAREYAALARSQPVR
jgi:branched-chain amino acid aminotransferase